MQVIRIPTSGDVTVVDVPKIDLPFLKACVGGYIEAVGLRDDVQHRPATMYLNEEGKLDNLPVNYLASIMVIAYGLVDTIVGDVVIVGGPDRRGNDTDLDPKFIAIWGPR